jgi:hypothetical protein
MAPANTRSALASVMTSTPSAARSEPLAAGPSCSIPPKTYADLETCRGSSEPISLDVADSIERKTVGRIAISSKDPTAILAAIGDDARKWSSGAKSFTVFAYAAVGDYAAGAGYNRGRLYWNNGGEITVNICTAISVADDGMDFCDDEAVYAVANR